MSTRVVREVSSVLTSFGDTQVDLPQFRSTRRNRLHGPQKHHQFLPAMKSPLRDNVTGRKWGVNYLRREIHCSRWPSSCDEMNSFLVRQLSPTIPGTHPGAMSITTQNFCGCRTLVRDHMSCSGSRNVGANSASNQLASRR